MIEIIRLMKDSGLVASNPQRMLSSDCARYNYAEDKESYTMGFMSAVRRNFKTKGLDIIGLGRVDSAFDFDPDDYRGAMAASDWLMGWLDGKKYCATLTLA